MSINSISLIVPSTININTVVNLTTQGTVSTPPSDVTHGSQITMLNTGYAAYFDSGLGRNLQSSDLTNVSNAVWASEFVSSGGTISKKRFLSDIIVDISNVKFIGCEFQTWIKNHSPSNSDLPTSGTVIEYCTHKPAGSDVGGSEAIRFNNYTIRRSNIRYFSDALKANGGTTLIEECYLRTAMADPNDHNDVIQNVGGSGTVTIRRCNLSIEPEILLTGGSGGPNACFMSADMNASSVFTGIVEDCLIDPYTTIGLRLYDGGLTSNITYQITGNKFIRRGTVLHRGSVNTTPLNQITWSNNTYADNGEIIPLG